MNENRAGCVALAAFVVGVVAAAGAVAYASYRANRGRVFGEPSVVPLWLLAGVATVCLVLCLVLMVVVFITRAPERDQIDRP
jgi:cation transporter-like permease